MSLRGLARMLGPPAIEAVPPQPPPSAVTLAFAFDAGYLIPFKVMIASLVASGNFLDAPVVVYSDDDAVATDPVVRQCADRISLLTGARKETLYHLAKTRVGRRKREAWNRGTFLKWAIFETQETDALLFLDVDMICLGDITGLLGEHPGRLMVCANQFRPSLRRGWTGRSLSSRRQRDRFLGSLTGKVPPDMATRVNSGVMLVRKPVLNDAFFEEITAFAAEEKTVNEQSQFSRYFARYPHKVGFVSTAYNFLENEMADLNWTDHHRILTEVKILHYAGSVKPWHRGLERDTRPGTLLWHRYRTFADGLLRLT